MITQNDLAMFGAAKNPKMNCTLEQARRVALLLDTAGIIGEIKINTTGATGPIAMPMVALDEVEGGIDITVPYHYVLIVSSPMAEGQTAETPTALLLAGIYNNLDAHDSLGRPLYSPMSIVQRTWDELSTGRPWNPLESDELKGAIALTLEDAWE